MRKGLASTALLTPWMTWKHGNDCIFNQAQLSVNTLVERMKEEAIQWGKARATGLGIVLPMNWVYISLLFFL
jgi:hypothetical protein